MHKEERNIDVEWRRFYYKEQPQQNESEGYDLVIASYVFSDLYNNADTGINNINKGGSKSSNSVPNFSMEKLDQSEKVEIDHTINSLWNSVSNGGLSVILDDPHVFNLIQYAR